MGLRERIEREVRAALRQTARQGGQVDVRVGRVNAVVVHNSGGDSSAEATAHQTAPIVQQPEPGAKEPPKPHRG